MSEGYLETDPEAIDAYFSSGKTRRQRRFFAYTDGFITCMALWPELISPEVWVPRLLGDVPNFKNTLEADVTMAVLNGRCLEIYFQLIRDPKAFAPKLPGFPRDKGAASAWADGFIDALRAEPEPWAEFFEPNPHVALIALAHLGSDPPPLEEGVPPANRQLLFAEAPETIALIVQETDAFWRARKPRPDPADLGQVAIPMHVESPVETHVPQVASRAGRNHPCPCGSGKKYKKCCGTH